MPQNNKNNLPRRVAFSGVLGALAVVFLFGGAVVPIATFMAPIFASLCLLPLAVEFGTRAALLAFAAVSLVSLLVVPDREVVLFFVLLLGYYPILQPVINRLKSRVLRWVLKIGLFNAAVMVVYTLLLLFFAAPPLREELTNSPRWYWAVLLAGGNATFVLYDILVDKTRLIYIHKVRNKLFH